MLNLIHNIENVKQFYVHYLYVLLFFCHWTIQLINHKYDVGIMRNH
jgi:hypothetical protein